MTLYKKLFCVFPFFACSCVNNDFSQQHKCVAGNSSTTKEVKGVRFSSDQDELIKNLVEQGLD
jgi:hypothetical protein